MQAHRDIETTAPRTGMTVLVKVEDAAYPAIIRHTDTHHSPPYYVNGPDVGGWVGLQQVILDPFTTDGR